MWRLYRAMSGASGLSGPSRDTELLFILSGKKNPRSPQTQPAGWTGNSPPSPADPGLGSALAGGFEDTGTQQSGTRHRCAATQALTWDGALASAEAQKAAADNHLRLHSSGPEKAFPQRLGPRGFLSVPPWLSYPQPGALGSRSGFPMALRDDQRAPGIQHQAPLVPRWGWDQGGGGGRVGAAPAPLGPAPCPPLCTHTLLGSGDAERMQRCR